MPWTWSRKTKKTKEMYGLNDALTESYGRRCLMARRLVERGVRFVQLYIENQIWDTHTKLDEGLRYSCGKTDKPSAALLKDLKQRGLLEDTLLIWGGEFGRLPAGSRRFEQPGQPGTGSRPPTALACGWLVAA